MIDIRLVLGIVVLALLVIAFIAVTIRIQRDGEALRKRPPIRLISRPPSGTDEPND